MFLVAHVFVQAVLPSLYAASKFLLMPLPACHCAPNCIPCPVHAGLKASSPAGQDICSLHHLALAWCNVHCHSLPK